MAEDDEIDDEATDEDETDAPPPAEVTPARFFIWRAPRLGLRNPQRMTNPVWSWLARRPGLSAYAANDKFSGPSSLEVGPGWCANRFGRSETRLPDGRVVEIGGEHEDYYDPDFYIYNDVVIKGPDGGVEIYGYPPDAFPPTDFHTATLIGGRIVIVGCLGYTWMRAPGSTPVFALDTGTFVMTRVATGGDPPGWISKHTAERTDAGTIVVRGGKRLVERDGQHDFIDNIDDWSLDPAGGVWTRLTDRRWPQYELARADGTRNDLFEIGSGAWYAEATSEYQREQLAELERRLGRLPDFALYAARYAPPLAFTPVPGSDDDEDAWRVTRIAVDGVTVRYREEHAAVDVMIEGALPPETVAAIVEDARAKLAALERTPYVARQVAGS